MRFVHQIVTACAGFAAFAALALASMIDTASAEPPKLEIKSMSVMGVMAGRTTRLVIYGDNLNPKAASIKAPIAVKLRETTAIDLKLKDKGNRQVAVEITVPANCPRETFELTLTQMDGTIVKTQLPVVDYAETLVPIKKPAGTFAEAMPLPGPSSAIMGSLDADTPDIVRFEAKAGQTWQITLLTGRAGSALDPVLRIRDHRHIPVALSVGDKKRDRRITFKAPTDGAYYVELTEAEAKGGPTCTYLMTIVLKN